MSDNAPVVVNGVTLGPNSPLRAMGRSRPGAKRACTKINPVPTWRSDPNATGAPDGRLTPLVGSGHAGQPTRLTLVLPEPPSLNAMIDLAKKRTKKTRTGGWMKRALPVVYDQEKEIYELECRAISRTLGIHPPQTPWARWRLERADFRLHGTRDTLELLAGLKWTVDWLVHEGFVVDDSPAHLLHIPMPGQRIERGDRGITIEISEVSA